MMKILLVTLCVLVPPIAVFPSPLPETRFQSPVPTTPTRMATPSTSPALPIRPAPVYRPPPQIQFFDGRAYEVEKKGWRDEDGILWKPITVTTTAYTWLDDLGSPAVPEPGVTASGTDAKRTYGLATDWKVLPKGVTLRIPGYGDAVVDDKCGKARQVWREDKDVLVDIRIPNKGRGGDWRSNDRIRSTAMRHGVREDRVVLRRITQGAR